MTDGAIAVLAGLLMAGALFAQVGDYILTVKGLDKGDKEIGIINRWVVAKWGVKALPRVTFLEVIVTLAIFGACFSWDPAYGASCAGGMLAAELVNDVRSLLLLRKK